MIFVSFAIQWRGVFYVAFTPVKNHSVYKIIVPSEVKQYVHLVPVS